MTRGDNVAFARLLQLVPGHLRHSNMAHVLLGQIVVFIRHGFYHAHCTTLHCIPCLKTKLQITVCCAVLDPWQVRDMVHDFYNSCYATCFAALESLKPLLAMDIHLHDHVKALMAEIKTRALVQVG